MADIIGLTNITGGNTYMETTSDNHYRVEILTGGRTEKPIKE